MKLKLIQLKAYHLSETDGDELFIKVRGSKIWPKAKKFIRINRAAEAVPLDTTLVLDNFSKSVSLELWEYDNPFSSQCLGEFNLSLDTKGASYVTTMFRKTKVFVSYDLTWEII